VVSDGEKLYCESDGHEFEPLCALFSPFSLLAPILFEIYQEHL
jgi:hypothetical protein